MKKELGRITFSCQFALDILSDKSGARVLCKQYTYRAHFFLMRSLSAFLSQSPWSTIALEESLHCHPTLRPAWTHLGTVPSLQECLAATNCWQSGGTCQASSTASCTFTWPTETCLVAVPRFGRREPIPPNTLTLPKSVLSYAMTEMDKVEGWNEEKMGRFEICGVHVDPH